MKVIPLTQGRIALVDDADFEWLTQWSWCLTRQGKNLYAKRADRNGTHLMHRVITGAPKGARVDHRDRNGLNNMQSNLRLATHAQNEQNRGPNANNTSGYKGVFWDPKNGRWYARIRADRSIIWLGRFDSPEDAAHAYDAAALQYHGEFAWLNFPSW